jgi:hypothetical protein
MAGSVARGLGSILNHPRSGDAAAGQLRHHGFEARFAPAGAGSQTTSERKGIHRKESRVPMIASTYPLLDAFWIMLWFFVFVAWIWALIAIFTDIFRSRDMGGFAKAVWFLFVLFIPLVGVFCYLLARGSGMHDRTAERLQQQQRAFDAYVTDRARSEQPSNADELAKLAQLKSTGVLTDSEYEAEKAKILTGHAA